MKTIEQKAKAYDDAIERAQVWLKSRRPHWKPSEKQPEVDLEKKVTFDCISKKVTMSVRELISYYIDRECCDAADECGF